MDNLDDSFNGAAESGGLSDFIAGILETIIDIAAIIPAAFIELIGGLFGGAEEVPEQAEQTPAANNPVP